MSKYTICVTKANSFFAFKVLFLFVNITYENELQGTKSCLSCKFITNNCNFIKSIEQDKTNLNLR